MNPDNKPARSPVIYEREPPDEDGIVVVYVWLWGRDDTHVTVYGQWPPDKEVYGG
jgi:hypothetical protein